PVAVGPDVSVTVHLEGKRPEKPTVGRSPFCWAASYSRNSQDGAFPGDHPDRRREAAPLHPRRPGLSRAIPRIWATIGPRTGDGQGERGTAGAGSEGPRLPGCVRGTLGREAALVSSNPADWTRTQVLETVTREFPTEDVATAMAILDT